jgi:hypothetical protein
MKQSSRCATRFHVLPFMMLLLSLSPVSSRTVQAQAQSLRSSQERFLEALRGNRLAITMTDGRPGGLGWDYLVREARAARFTLIGEEPGVAETAQLSAALFGALRESGYSRLAVAFSPPIARDVEAAARRNGVEGIVDFLSTPGISTFLNLREETQFLADVIKDRQTARPPDRQTNEQVLWGFDREVFSDRYLVAKLEAKVPVSAREPFARLKQAQANAWARYDRNPDGDNLFLLAEEPALVTAVRNAWRQPDAESDAILRTLEESLAIETAERTGGLWPYMQRRTSWIRANVAALLKDGQQRTPSPKVMLKGGYLHMIRGPNYLNMFDLGAMADEVAALSGDRAFHIIVLPGPGSRQAAPGGSVSSDEVDALQAGDQRLTRVLSNPNAAGHEVIDLRALRRLAMRGLESWNADLIRTIHGYDAAVIWKGARASSALK